MDFPLVSIIIPCYNQGHFIQDALDSIAMLDNNSYEIIIINDGSTDSFTKVYLQQLSEKGFNVINQENKGLGFARNIGIKASKGKYILPLDSDNKLSPNALNGLEILESNSNVDVVYGDRLFFGDKTGVEYVGAFNLQKLMLGNYIDACALIRKSVIEAVGFYSPMKIMGCEDWDLWLRIAFGGYVFYYTNDVMFDYRVTKKSMLRSLNANIKKQNELEQYFIDKYKDKLNFQLLEEAFIYKIKKKPIKFLWRLILKKYFPKFFNQLINTNRIYRGFLYSEI